MQKELDVLIAESFNEKELAKIITSDSKYYWINTSGSVVSEIKAHVEFKDFKDGKKQYALINQSGDIVVPYGIYNDINFMIMGNHDGTAFVAQKDDSSVALIDEKGKEIVPFGYYNIIFQSAAVGLPENYPKGFVLPYEIGQNTYVVIKHDKIGLINDKGEEILPCIYDFDQNSDDYFLAWYVGAEKMLSQFAQPEKVVVPNLVSCINEDLFRCGYVNQQNELVIPYKFRGADGFKCGLALVSEAGYVDDLNDYKWFHIDESGERLQYKINYNNQGEIISG